MARSLLPLRSVTALTTHTRADIAPQTGGNRTLAEPFVFKYGVLPEEFTKPKKRKTIVGVGVELRAGEAGSADEGLFVVADTTAGGPAAAGGIRPLDRVLAIDGARFCSFRVRFRALLTFFFLLRARITCQARRPRI